MVDFRRAADRIRPSVIGIGRAKDFDFEIFGTGYLIDGKGTFMTNQHVLEPLLASGQKISSDAAAFLFIQRASPHGFGMEAGVAGTRIHEIFFPPAPPVSGDEPPLIGGRVPDHVLAPEAADIGFGRIKLDNCPPEVLPLRPVQVAGADHALEGLPVGIFGFPQGLQFPKVFKSRELMQLTPILQTGVIAAVLPHSKIAEPEVFILDLHVNPGSSGSPLFTAEGNVIGIVYATRQRFSPLIKFDEQGKMFESQNVGVYLPSSLGVAIPSNRFPKEIFDQHSETKN